MGRGSSSEVISRSGPGSQGGWVRQGREDARAPVWGGECGEEKEDPGESGDGGGRTYLYSRCSS